MLCHPFDDEWGWTIEKLLENKKRKLFSSQLRMKRRRKKKKKKSRVHWFQRARISSIITVELHKAFNLLFGAPDYVLYLPTYPEKNLFIFQQQQQQPTPLPSVHLFSFFGWMMKEELNGSWKTEGQRTFQAPSKNIDFLLSFYFKESPPLFHFSCVPLP